MNVWDLSLLVLLINVLVCMVVALAVDVEVWLAKSGNPEKEVPGPELGAFEWEDEDNRPCDVCGFRTSPEELEPVYFGEPQVSTPVGEAAVETRRMNSKPKALAAALRNADDIEFEYGRMLPEDAKPWTMADGENITFNHPVRDRRPKEKTVARVVADAHIRSEADLWVCETCVESWRDIEGDSVGRDIREVETS